MQAILTIVVAVFKLIGLMFQKANEADQAKKEQLEIAEKEVKDGIKRRDPSAITGGFDRARRI